MVKCPSADFASVDAARRLRKALKIKVNKHGINMVDRQMTSQSDFSYRQDRDSRFDTEQKAMDELAVHYLFQARFRNQEFIIRKLKIWGYTQHEAELMADQLQQEGAFDNE